MNAIASRFSRLTLRQRLIGLMVVAMLAMPLAAFAQVTPEPPMGVDEIITTASGVITDFNLMPFITVAAVIGVAIYLYARVRRSSR